MKKENLPKKLAVFPLSNFIIFPKTAVPLNIFEPRYVDMINDSMKSNKFIGMVQPKNTDEENNYVPNLYQIGCMGKITSFKEVDEGRFLIELKGLIRFQITKEIRSDRKYRECEINFENYYGDLEENRENLNFSDLKLIFRDLKSLFEKKGFMINWKALEKQNLDETINALSMASPFTLEEKQVLLEAKSLSARKTKIAEILTTYTFDNYNNKTIQ
jgi:uncharacterized protein